MRPRSLCAGVPGCMAHADLYRLAQLWRGALSGAERLFYLAVQDTYYYWAHRVMHHPRLFSWMHAGHHRSRQPTPFASFAFDPAEALVQPGCCRRWCSSCRSISAWSRAVLLMTVTRC